MGTVANGTLALKKHQAGRYDPILSDIKMPELDGPGLYRKLERCHPALCRSFIFLTRDSLSRETREFLETSGVPGVSKPFALEEIRQVVQRILRAQVPG